MDNWATEGRRRGNGCGCCGDGSGSCSYTGSGSVSSVLCAVGFQASDGGLDLREDLILLEDLPDKLLVPVLCFIQPVKGGCDQPLNVGEDIGAYLGDKGLQVLRHSSNEVVEIVPSPLGGAGKVLIARIDLVLADAGSDWAGVRYRVQRGVHLLGVHAIAGRRDERVGRRRSDVVGWLLGGPRGFGVSSGVGDAPPRPFVRVRGAVVDRMGARSVHNIVVLV